VAGLSIFDPIYLGVDENGRHVYLDLSSGRAILTGGEPRAGKSVFVQNILGHAALCTDARLVLLDGKLVELGLWRQVADVFVGANLDDANAVMHWLQREIDNRLTALGDRRERKIVRSHGVELILAIIDEIALYSATLGRKEQQEEFSVALRDVVARGPAAGVVTIAATQRPSADIIPTSLRDIFGYRCAFRCTTDVSSDIILGFGWAGQGYSAMSIAPEDQGIGWLLAEEGKPRRFKAAYLSDHDIDELVDRAVYIRRPLPWGTTNPGATGQSGQGAREGWSARPPSPYPRCSAMPVRASTAT
jgi:S-DNA-T family DNA segregation ATPase FtsK/SpoIIIE